ncbi:amidase family protein [Dactylosporangium sp. NPDC005572]|uniref:amidase n=1 Tax=Dactylosporangium sp. NPDC005572 TaxID=3156889 RepID=UPI00339F4500
MELHEYARLDGVAIAALVRAGEVSAAEVERVALLAVEAADRRVNGLAGPLFRVPGDPRGPFFGVPFLVKDVPMAAGIPFGVGSRAVPPFVVAEHDTEVMARFRWAGLLTLGRTTMPELGLSFATEPRRHGPARNPYDPARGAGGSSGGAAALVAAGAVPIAHANDGAGSIRVPASCCGLVGLKPSAGRLPGSPHLGEFALTRTVRDTVRLFEALYGPAFPTGTDLSAFGRSPDRALRAGITTVAWSGVPVHPEVAAATERAGKLLERLGLVVEPAAPRLDWDDVRIAMRGDLAANVAPMLAAPRPPDPAKLEAVTRAVIAGVHTMSALDLLSAAAAAERVARGVWGFFAEYDLLLTPTLAQLPAEHGTLDYDDPRHTVDGWLDVMLTYGPFTTVFNLSGQPAVSLPLGRSEGGLPIGVQVVAAHGREDHLLALAAMLESDFADLEHRETH